MSRWLNRARRRARDGETGFTLIEIMVAITLVGIAAAGSIPLLVVGMKAANNSKLNTQAKNLAQQRIESMRDLPFHVDAQNGPFIDLLDIYYTNLSTTPSAPRNRAGETEVGQWYSGSQPAPAPSGPFYQVSVGSITGFTSFTQTIDTQFLTVAGNPVTVAAASGYDNLAAGKDQPMSTIVGVTVITTWNDHGVTHNYTSYTRISDSRGLTSTLTTQGSASFMRVSSAGPTGNALTVDVTSADATGSQSTGSVAAADVRTIDAHDANGQVFEGASAVATDPTENGLVTPTGPQNPWSAAGGGQCGWVGSGFTQYADVSAAVTGSGLPQVPSTVDNASPPTHQATAQITTASSGACGIFGFANQSTSYDPDLMLSSGSTADDTPLVRINNDSGNTVAVSGSAWVNATASTATPHTASSGANTSSANWVRLFPGAQFTGGKGVVRIKLTQASISCLSSVSGGTATDTASASWTVNMSYWLSSDTSGHGAWFDLPPYTWNSATGTGSADPLAAIDPTSIVVYQNGSTVLHLSDYISSWGTTRKITQNGSSAHQMDGIVSIATTPVRDGDLLSAIGLQVGNLSCVADDSR